MEINLNDIETRVLGCLMEKELATPEYYPLTLNSLTTACNQKSNRDPVMALEESEVVHALNALKMKHVAILSGDGGRVPKYRHILAERMKLEPPELAVLAELLLRGPQTLAELRARGERMTPLGDQAAVEELLQELTDRGMVTKLPRQPGRKEARYAHLLAGEPVVPEETTAAPEASRLRVMAENERLGRLEEEVATLRLEVAELRSMVAEFKAQFE
jgi:uncharacterized protein YceH (UPF0502 family)